MPRASLTMTFVVMGLGTVFNALTNRRDPASGLDAADPEGARRRARPGRADLPGDRSSRACRHGLLTTVAHRAAVARRASGSRWRSRS